MRLSRRIEQPEGDTSTHQRWMHQPTRGGRMTHQRWTLTHPRWTHDPPEVDASTHQRWTHQPTRGGRINPPEVGTSTHPRWTHQPTRGGRTTHQRWTPTHLLTKLCSLQGYSPGSQLSVSILAHCAHLTSSLPASSRVHLELQIKTYKTADFRTGFPKLSCIVFIRVFSLLVILQCTPPLPLSLSLSLSIQEQRMDYH